VQSARYVTSVIYFTHLTGFLQVLEETGYNLAGQLDPANVIEMSIKEQKISLFIVPGVPEDFEFQTRTRKEISVRDFRSISELIHAHSSYVLSKLHGSNCQIYQLGNGVKPNHQTKNSILSHRSLGRSFLT